MANPAPIVHVDLDIPSYTISHPVHGNAQCDDRQWPEFEANGWKKSAAKAKKPRGSKSEDDVPPPGDVPPSDPAAK